MDDFLFELDKLYSAGDLSAVEAFLLEAADASPDGSTERAALLNELAGFYRGVSRYDESEDAFNKSLELFEKNDMGATPEYATVLLNLAGLYRMKGDAEKAIGLFLNSKSKLEGAGAQDSYSYISVMNNLALAYQEKGDYEQALDYASKALELLRHGDSFEHEIAASLNNLAAIQLRLGEVEIARGLISESLAIYDGMDEPDVHHAAALTTNAVISHRNGDLSGALDGFRRALDLTKRFFGENVEYAICKRNIADVCELIGDIPAAILELSDSIRVMEVILEERHPSLIDARNMLERLRGAETS